MVWLWQQDRKTFVAFPNCVHCRHLDTILVTLIFFNDESVLHIVHRFTTDISKIVVSDVNHIVKYSHSSSDVQCKRRTPGYCHFCGVEENNAVNVPWSSKESYYNQTTEALILQSHSEVAIVIIELATCTHTILFSFQDGIDSLHVLALHAHVYRYEMWLAS